jgi:DNA-3-methyladenine glycosylase I
MRISEDSAPAGVTGALYPKGDCGDPLQAPGRRMVGAPPRHRSVWPRTRTDPAKCHALRMNQRAELVSGPDGVTRCWWGSTDPLYVAYHDEEWGRPLRGDDALFELLTLEGFQAGLSWLIILRKRPAFRTAFDGFRIERVARFGDDDVERLLGDAAIVRNRAKIEATIANAQSALELGPGGLTDLLWSFAPAPRARRPQSFAEIPAQTPESEELSKELRSRGFRFVGPTIVYALMQTVGMVDDHLAGCDITV